MKRATQSNDVFNQRANVRNSFFSFLSLSFISLLINTVLLLSLERLSDRRKTLEEQKTLLQLELEKKMKEISDQQMQTALSARMASLGVMAGGIAHEINNPMHIIQGKVELLQDLLTKNNFSREEANLALTRISAMILRVTKIIKTMRSLSRKADNDPLSKISIKDIVEDAITLSTEKLKNMEIQLINEVHTDTFIMGRSAELSQVLINLLNNSRDAVEKLVAPWIKIDCRKIDRKILLSVTDSGKAIAPEVAEKIMEPFFTTKEAGKGTGLGLSISQTIMKKNEGRLYFENRNGNSCFVLEFTEVDA